MNSLKSYLLVYIMVIAIVMFCGCATNFAGKVPLNPRVRFITGNEKLDPSQYAVKGVVVIQRQKIFFDIWELVKPLFYHKEEAYTNNFTPPKKKACSTNETCLQ